MTFRRVLASVALAVVAFAVTGVAQAPPASAHPLGNFTVNRYSGIVVTPGNVSLSYVLDMAEIPTFQEMEVIDADADGTASETEKQVWADTEAREIASNLALEVDGRPATLELQAASMSLGRGQGGLSVLRMEAAFSASVPSSGSVAYRDDGYAGRIGWKEITVRAGAGVEISRSSVPASSVSGGLRSYPDDLLSSPLDVSRAAFSFGPGTSSSVAPPGDASGATTPSTQSGGRFASLVTRTGMSFPVLLLTLLLAFGLGALHALGPGHGKTIMAAYLVGAEGRLRQAVAVGAAISIMHTASVLVLGFATLYATRLFSPDRVYPWLGLVSGVIVVVLGARLLWARMNGRRHSDDSHHHEHGHDHDHPGDHHHAVPRKPISREGLIALAVSGGMLPSPTALVVLVAAIALHRVGYGLTLIAAFSLGLAAALVAVGTVAMRAGSVVSRRLGSRAAALLPQASAGILLVAGVVLTTRGVLQVL